jgi:phospholipase/carboxylesterase
MMNGERIPSWYDMTEPTAIRAKRNPSFPWTPMPDTLKRDLQESMLAIQTLIEEEVRNGCTKLILGGFSQGAALSLHMAYRMQCPQLVGVIALSGYLLEPLPGEKNDDDNYPPALVCHGRDDDMVPFVAGKAVCNVFQSRHMNIDFREFSDLGHSSSHEEILIVAEFVRDRFSTKHLI